MSRFSTPRPSFVEQERQYMELASPAKETVPCYPLSAVLTPGQFKQLGPYLGATFSETWKNLCTAFDADVFALRQLLRKAAGAEFYDSSLYQECGRAEGREIERRLYARARDCFAQPVQGPPRST